MNETNKITTKLTEMKAEAEREIKNIDQQLKDTKTGFKWISQLIEDESYPHELRAFIGDRIMNDLHFGRYLPSSQSSQLTPEKFLDKLFPLIEKLLNDDCTHLDFIKLQQLDENDEIVEVFFHYCLKCKNLLRR